MVRTENHTEGNGGFNNRSTSAGGKMSSPASLLVEIISLSDLNVIASHQDATAMG